MIRILIIFLCCFWLTDTLSQTTPEKLATAYQQFENDPQLQSAIASLYIVDATNGKVIFDKNSTTGLAPASTQKIITSATAYELLGSNFSYKTAIGYQKNDAGTLATLYIFPCGDPTLGSWRWENTKEETAIKRIVQAVKRSGIKNFSAIALQNTGWESETIPDGWIWQDIGNYYGAGAAALNWRENQFDLILRSGSRVGDSVMIAGTVPKLYAYDVISRASSAPKGTGDNSFIYFPLASPVGIIRGTIPVNESHFIVSGAMPSAANQFISTLIDSLHQSGIAAPSYAQQVDEYNKYKIIDRSKITIFFTEYSPSLDSINYWFLKKSINLYGEAFLKTIAYQKGGFGSTDTGVAIVKRFWQQRGLSENELHIVDGSGLSPLNRVTTHAQVTILQYAKAKPWFNSFYYALPEYNGMKMKSGTINGVKGFAGYHTAKKGAAYIFSFLVNNYNGSPSTLVEKMYKVLDVLK